MTSQEIHKLLLDHWTEQSTHYGWEGDWPDYVRFRVQKAIASGGTPEAIQRAKTRMETALLAAWARGEIPGPTNSRTLEKAATKAESLAGFLDKRGLKDQADQQRKRAEDLRKQVKDLTKGVG